MTRDYSPPVHFGIIGGVLCIYEGNKGITIPPELLPALVEMAGKAMKEGRGEASSGLADGA